MNQLKLIIALLKSGILSSKSIITLFRSIRNNGVNLMALVQYAGTIFANRIAVVDDEEQITYEQLFMKSIQLSMYFKKHFKIEPKDKVALFCRNHNTLILSIIAFSRLGVSTYLINTEMSRVQFENITERHQFKLLLLDDEFENDFLHIENATHKIIVSQTKKWLKSEIIDVQIPTNSTSNLILLTSGSTGLPKEVSHKPSLVNYLAPFLGMVNRLNLLRYHSVYIATPIYHGYGVAILLLFIALGKKIVVTKNFNATESCALIERHKIEIVTVVPLMIQKMLQVSPVQLRSVQCFASGGAKIHPSLVRKVKEQLGDVLYNLYGTSETGLNIIATPDDFSYNSKTLGKKINGMQLKIRRNDEEVDFGKIGELFVKTNSGMESGHSKWMSTGDLVYRDKYGYYYLVGRKDDMIVSGGENVYPSNVETILLQHPEIIDVAMIDVDDELFGKRLHAFVQLHENCSLTEQLLKQWLKNRVARYEMPKAITFMSALPYTEIGKLNKKMLRASLKNHRKDDL